jgi:hypothetical protein
MGRGRAKAKQTKVARDLKYRTYQTDFSSLERELGVHPTESGEAGDADYAEYAERYTEEDELEDGSDLDEDEDEDDEFGRRIG